MATSINQPFLDTPKRKASSFKLYLVFVTLAAVLGSIAVVVSFLVFNSSISTFLSLKYSNICDKALDQSSCLAMVSEVAPAKTNNKIEILQKILSKTSWKIQETTTLMDNVHRRINDRREQAGLATCMELMEMSRDSVTDSMVALGNLTTSSHFDVHTWVSSVVADLDTCMNELHGRAKSIMDPMLKDLMSRVSACLALIVAISKPKQPYLDNLQPLHGLLPSWVSSADSKLLDASAADINANVVVAKDGSGNYKTVTEAVESAPTNSDRYVIYIKAGTYNEIVRIASNKRNIMLVGDGLKNTIITGSLNAAENVSTFNTPTVASNAVGFIAQDLCIQNTAGPEGYQAVALRVSGDKSVINRCKIDAYQDSLYVHQSSQFYRHCYITGTIDFIFGYAAVVLQKCRIVARKPMVGQRNMITAHNKVEANVNTGISIQNCKITPSEDLVPVQKQFKSFFGRPWGKYATTVVMQSYIDDHIDPAGWAPWNNTDFALDTLYYGEYMNRGPGADTSERVTWKGFHVITNASEAEKFTVAKLIEGQSWIKAAGVPFKEGL